MKSKSISKQNSENASYSEGLFGFENSIPPQNSPFTYGHESMLNESIELPEILFITSYPPRECGIATYSQDLIKVLNNKFSNSFSIKVCALESNDEDFQYSDNVKYTLKTSLSDSYGKLALTINNDDQIKIILIQHEFGFFRKQERSFMEFLTLLTKPIVVDFHTVLPFPDKQLKLTVKSIAAKCSSVIVMTHNSADILINDYGLPKEKISVIAHGTHLVPHLNKDYLKKKYGFEGRKVLTTFGLLSSGKGIETTIKALPHIVKSCPEALFLIIGKTHPEVLKEEGEKYRNRLEAMIISNKLAQHVKFVNSYLHYPIYLNICSLQIFICSLPMILTRL